MADSHHCHSLVSPQWRDMQTQRSGYSLLHSTSPLLSHITGAHLKGVCACACVCLYSLLIGLSTCPKCPFLAVPRPELGLNFQATSSVRTTCLFHHAWLFTVPHCVPFTHVECNSALLFTALTFFTELLRAHPNDVLITGLIIRLVV